MRRRVTTEASGSVVEIFCLFRFLRPPGFRPRLVFLIRHPRFRWLISASTEPALKAADLSALEVDFSSSGFSRKTRSTYCWGVCLGAAGESRSTSERTEASASISVESAKILSPSTNPASTHLRSTCSKNFSNTSLP